MSRGAARRPEETAGIAMWLVQHAQLAWRLFLDGRVSFIAKLLPILVVAYLFIPLDVLPDVILALGIVDDLALMALVMRLFIAVCPPACVQEHMDDIRAGRPRRRSERNRGRRGKIIDVPYREV